MMGVGHALMGASVWVALTAPSPVGVGLVPLDNVGVTVGAVACAGAALLPDADHPNGTISHALPPVTTAVAAATSKLSGGHRHATHSLLGVVFFVALAWAVTPLRATLWGHEVQLGAAVLLVVLSAFAFRALGVIRERVSAWLVAVGGAAAMTWYAPEQYWWLPLVVLVGVVVHLVGDLITTEGIPVLWPWNPKPKRPNMFWSAGGYFSIPILGSANSLRAGVLTGLMGLYVAGGLVSVFEPGAVPWLWEQVSTLG